MSKKELNNEEYQRVIKDIATYEEFNALYYELLFSCIWNGIYNDDLSVIKNLRASNIGDDGIVILEEDNGHVYKFKISEKLASDLKQLASINTWQRQNRFGICNVEMRGVYQDSVFKIENRSTASNDSYRFTYYAKLRKIAKEYLELYINDIINPISIVFIVISLGLILGFIKIGRVKLGIAGVLGSALILGMIMGISFLGLLYLQVNYMEETVKMRRERFEESVQRSLDQACRNVELAETRSYLEADAAATEKAAQKAVDEKENNYDEITAGTKNK